MNALDQALTIAKKRFCKPPPEQSLETSDSQEVTVEAEPEKEEVEGNGLVMMQHFDLLKNTHFIIKSPLNRIRIKVLI